jgi:predicted nucleotide-binding protein (sugar kinase/HSP70/actin superfamily)
LARWFDRRPSVDLARRRNLRIGIPKLLNIWSTHQFWWGFFAALGVDATTLTFSSDTSEEQGRQFGKGRGAVDCCYPVKCGAGHYGELLFGLKRPITVLFSPMIASLPSFLRGHVVDSLACPRVMAAPENLKAGFLKEQDGFAAQGVRYVSPLVTLAEPRLVPRQLFGALQDVVPDLTREETERAVEEGYAALEAFSTSLRARSRDILATCAREDAPCLLVLARPYHMDPGIGHEIEVDLQAFGYPVLWGQYLPVDADLMDWMFGDDVRAGAIRSPLDIADVWPSSYSANTNEILWAAKVAARVPWIACVVRLASYECGMDQPTYTPVQRIVEGSGTLFFSFQELDATKPAGSVKIRVETIAHYLERSAASIIARKRAAMRDGCPLLTREP